MYSRILAVAALAVSMSSGAQAAVVEVRFQEAPGYAAGYQIYGPSVYLDGQIAFRDQAAMGDYDFRFTYDTEDPSATHGLALVSGRVGSFTDFAGFAPVLTFGASNSLLIGLQKTETAGSSTYLTGVYFVMQDNDGDIPATLPTSLDFSALDQATASFETRRNGGVGLGYYNVGYAKTDGVLQVPTGSGDPTGGGSGGTSGAVPEPAAWAMMILGFGAAGGLLRRRGRAYAASNCSAARRA